MKYISKNCGKEVTAAQYLAETMITRQAQRSNTALPFKFWNVGRWQKDFKQQLFKAYALLKLYPEEVVVKAIDKTPWLTTLLWKDISSILDKEQEAFDLLKKLARETPKFEDVNVDVSQKKFSSKSNKLSKLQDLDNE